MTNIKVVIGANFGDCGKGLMTDFFCNEAFSNRESCLVVLSNGGSQRSHTVTTPYGLRHAFSHFGSGTFAGADTYFPKQFIVNPMNFIKEYKELEGIGCDLPNVYMNPECMLTTPFDMIINQIIEENRGNNRHGSCGQGIWETIVRNGMRIEEFSRLAVDQQIDYLRKIRDDYFPKRLKEYGIESISSEWKDIINSELLILNYLFDFGQMMVYTIDSANGFTDDNILKSYDSIVFENGQGLLLDQNIEGYGEHTTPSNTGSKNPLEIINSVFKEDDYALELCYVTRSYMTRHGAGRFDTECKKEDINPEMVDLTNVPNPHQGSLRYGGLDLHTLVERVQNDSKNINGRTSLAVTHLNEYEIVLKDIESDFDIIYQSNGYDRNSIKVMEKTK